LGGGLAIGFFVIGILIIAKDKGQIMEMVTVISMVGLPVMAFGIFVLIKLNQQERREKETKLKVQNS
jgi:putative exporter of polyketide antibiotics